MAAFQKGNRRAMVGSDHASLYTPAAINSNTNASNPLVIQQVVPFAFKGTGQIEVTVPPGTLAANFPNSVSLGTAYLIANASGGYAAGFHPLVQYSVFSTVAANQVINNVDVIIVQY